MKWKAIKLAGLGALAAAVALAVAVPAAGHRVIFDSQLQQFKIDATSTTQDTFSGRVRSTKPRCESGRLVNVMHNGVTIATATSDVAGNWTVLGPRPPKGDDVTAFMPKKVLKKNRRHRHRCARDVITRKAP